MNQIDVARGAVTQDRTRDAVVKSILSELDLAATSADFSAPMVRASQAIRAHSLASAITPLRPSQKHLILKKLGKVYPRIYASADDDAGRREATMVANSLATLTLIWAGDDKKWTVANPAAQDASDLCEAFELDQRRYLILENVLARKKTLAVSRTELFNTMITGVAGAPGGVVK